MIMLAVIQAAALTLLHAPLTALMRHRAAQGAVLLIGSRLMTIYLWHLPMIMVLIGTQLALPRPLPAPGGALWWWTRPLFLLVVLAAVWVLPLWLIRFEQAPPSNPTRFLSKASVIVAVLVFIAPIIAITAYGLDFPLAAIALACTALSLWLTGARRNAA